MRTPLRSLVVALLVGAAPALLGAQDGRSPADFPEARREFLAGDVRQAAHTLLLASAHLRQELGRCRDELLFDRMRAGEARLDALAARLRAGQGASVAALDAAAVATDRLLAEHHVLAAAWGVENPRHTTVATVGRDVERATFHWTRAERLDGRTPDAAAQRALDDARGLAGRLATAERIPADAGRVVAALRTVIVPPVIAIVR